MQSLPLYDSPESASLAAQDCVACQRARSRKIVVFGHGNPDSQLMLVGEAPSATDDSTGKPFTGPAGRLLDEVLAEAGISRRDVWITNLTRCFAGRERNGRVENRPATVREITACRTWMSIELQLVNPSVILAIGAPTARELIDPDFKLQEQRGEAFNRPDGRSIIATIQPAYVMRLVSLVDRAASDAARELLAADVRLAVQTARIAADST
jgi:uracil-DNA glycosylase